MAEADAVPNSIAILTGVTSLLSLASLFYLFQKHIAGRPLLAYEPRKRVPWGAGVALFAMAMPLFGVALYFTTFADSSLNLEPAPEPIDEELQPMVGWGDFAFMVGFVPVVGFWITMFFRADHRDFGLPSSWSEARRDVGIGCFAAIASMVPIYAVQLTLITSLDVDTKHPLVEQVEASETSSILVLAFAMAVIAAPLFEEFTFRCLLQGWLEKHEDELLGYNATRRWVPQAPEVEPTEANSEASHLPAVAKLDSEPEPTLDDPREPDERPPVGWIAELPHGWTPILISGVLFGLAHLGHGVAPVSLVLFGIVLGYLYQRTHRLMPCIAAHMFFNGYSMLLLWLQLKPGH